MQLVVLQNCPISMFLSGDGLEPNQPILSLLCSVNRKCNTSLVTKCGGMALVTNEMRHSNAHKPTYACMTSEVEAVYFSRNMTGRY